jgi:hypothetical protein
VPQVHEFNRLIKLIADLLLSEIPAGLGDKKWKLKTKRWNSAYIDSRWTTDGNTRIGKLRVVLRDGRIFARIRIPQRAAEWLDAIGELKDKAFPEPWYGLKITISPDGSCRLDFDHNTECVVDPTFFNPD